METRMITFFVHGLPKTAGSKRAFYKPGMRFPVIVDDCAKSKDWKHDVKMSALEHRPATLLTGPLRVELTFTLPRAKGHFGSGKNAAVLKPSAPMHHIIKPDVLKMARAVEDALTGIIYADDSQICDERLLKWYGEQPGVEVRIYEITPAMIAS